MLLNETSQSHANNNSLAHHPRSHVEWAAQVPSHHPSAEKWLFMPPDENDTSSELYSVLLRTARTLGTAVDVCLAAIFTSAFSVDFATIQHRTGRTRVATAIIDSLISTHLR